MKKILFVAAIGAIVLSGCSEKEVYQVEPWTTTKVEATYTVDKVAEAEKAVKQALVTMNIQYQEEGILNASYVSPNSPYAEELSELKLGVGMDFPIELTTKQYVVAAAASEGGEAVYLLLENVDGDWLLYGSGPKEFFGDAKTFAEFTLSDK